MQKAMLFTACKLRAIFPTVLLCLIMSSFGSAQTVLSYVSTGAGSQILTFNDSGTIQSVCNMTVGTDVVTPEDLVTGPDGNLYVADTTHDKIFRVQTSLGIPTKDGSGACNKTVVYQKSDTTQVCKDLAGSTVTCPAAPEGPSFLRINSLDLYFNTNGANASGLWKIPGAANSTNNLNNGLCNESGQPTCGSPMQVSPTVVSGEGLDFDVFGKLLAVQGNSVVRASVSCLTGTACVPDSIAGGLSSPVGIAVNTCGDILVSNGNSIQRFTDANPAQAQETLSFNGNNTPRFFEVDSQNRLFVITAADETGKQGTFWRFDPPAPALRSCNLSLFTTAVNVPIKTNLAAGIATTNALGLALSASSTSILAHFTAGNNGTNSNSYDFGAQHSLQVTCGVVLKNFDLTVTAVKSRPTDAANAEVMFSPATNWPTQTTTQCGKAQNVSQPVCMHYGGQHGFCTQYIETAVDPSNGLPIADSSLMNFCSGNSFNFAVNFASAEPILNPGGAHVSTDAPPDDAVTRAYTDCQSQDFYPQDSTGDPVTLRGSNSKHVVFNSEETFAGQITLNSPISSCTTTDVTTCNPQFNIGQNISVKFTLLSPDGTPVVGAVERLSIERVFHTTGKGQPFVSDEPPLQEAVISTKNSNVLNFFNGNKSGQYSYNVDSSKFSRLDISRGSTAIYRFILWGNGASQADPNATFLVTGAF
jgi:hypothetical protein